MPMLTIFRRHVKGCEHRGAGRKYRRCRCPVWVDGFLGAEEIRESLKTRNWEAAQETIRKWEADGRRGPEPEAEAKITIEQAQGEFLADARARKLREPTLYKYRLLFSRLLDFARDKGLRYIEELDLSRLRAFRASWTGEAGITAQKKLERLRAFFRFAHDGGWTDGNPAAKLKNPKITQPPTLPFAREETVRTLAACDFYPDNYGRTGQENARRLRALVLLLRYSGLRIRDAVTLPREHVAGNKLFLYTAKTGVPVWCPLPQFVIDALDLCPGAARYFFWSGESKPKSAVGDWQRSLRKLFALAGVPGGHAHRFRDTFAVELLLAGVPLERVSMLLGHASVKVTEKHYAPWVLARQEQLEADVRRTWGEDATLLPQTKGTPEVHGKRQAPN